MSETRADEFSLVTQLSQSGQVTIPKGLRAAFGLSKGGTIRISSDAGRIIIEPVAVMPLASISEVEAATEEVAIQYAEALRRLGNA